MILVQYITHKILIMRYTAVQHHRRENPPIYRKQQTANSKQQASTEFKIKNSKEKDKKNPAHTHTHIHNTQQYSSDAVTSSQHMQDQKRHQKVAYARAQLPVQRLRFVKKKVLKIIIIIIIVLQHVGHFLFIFCEGKSQSV